MAAAPRLVAPPWPGCAPLQLVVAGSDDDVADAEVVEGMIDGGFAVTAVRGHRGGFRPSRRGTQRLSVTRSAKATALSVGGVRG